MHFDFQGIISMILTKVLLAAADSLSLYGTLCTYKQLTEQLIMGCVTALNPLMFSDR